MRSDMQHGYAELPRVDRATSQAAALPKRVAVWYPRLATSGYSGPSANFMRLFADGSEKLRFTLVTSAPETVDPPPSMQLQHVARRSGPLPKHEQVLMIASMLKWIWVHRHSFDVFYGLSSFHYSVIPAFFAHLLGRKAVVRPAGQQDYDPGPSSGPRRIAVALKRAMLRRLDGVVAINSHIRDKFVEFGLPAERVCFAPNSVDVERFRPAPRAGRAMPLTIVHVGGWTARKRLHVLVQAVRLARDQGLAARIVCAGPQSDPAYARQVEALVDGCGLRESFEWRGEVKQVEEVYLAGDVFCLPSSTEGMPNALLEAMACGLPAIVTILPGTADVVRDGVEGFLLPQPTDDGVLAQQIASCIVRYAQDPELLRSHADAARQRILQTFTRDGTKARIEGFLVRICG